MGKFEIGLHPVTRDDRIWSADIATPDDGVSHERYRNIHWSNTISGPHKIRGRSSRHVRFGSQADMCAAKRHVRFTPQ